MGKKVKYMVLDTETATLPFIGEWNLCSEDKKKLAIAKPLVYDIGWVIATRTDGIINRKNYLVAETFSVPSVFNTAYYKDKRPQYLEMIKRNEVKILPWDDIMEIMIEDLKECDFCCAYNAMFDFKKAIPFTEVYIRHLYNADYYDWEQFQKEACQKILNEPKKDEKNPNFDKLNFLFRDEKYPMIDIWGQACETFINVQKYKKMCLENSYLTNSGVYFSTSAENVKRYLEEKYDFIESHTALDDAEIETSIFFKAIKSKKRVSGIIDFPFRILGETVDFCKNTTVTSEMRENCMKKLQTYHDNAPDTTKAGKTNGYKTHIRHLIEELEKVMEELG